MNDDDAALTSVALIEVVEVGRKSLYGNTKALANCYRTHTGFDFVTILPLAWKTTQATAVYTTLLARELATTGS
jgi:hypothetical protein